MSDNKKYNSRRIGTICHHIFVAVAFVALFFMVPPKTVSTAILPDYNHFGGNSQHQRTLIITSYDEIVDERYASLDYLGALLRGIDIANSDIILINSSMAKSQQKEVFDKAMFEYLTIDNKYSNIVGINDGSMLFAVEAKHMYYPDANIFCFNQTNMDSANLKLITEYHPDFDYKQNVITDLNNVEQFELVKRQINSTIEGALELYPDKSNIVLVVDNKDYSQKVIDITMDNDHISDKEVKILNVNSKEVYDIDYSDSIVLFAEYPRNFQVIMYMHCSTQLPACFDISQDKSTAKNFIRPLRLLNYCCDHEPTVIRGGDVSSVEYLTRDTLEKALLSCVGLNHAALSKMGIDAVDTAHFINYGLMHAGVDYYGSDVKTQVDTCIDKNILTPKTQLKLGNLIYYSDVIYPDINDVSNVQVYFGYETVLHVNENGRIVCSKPVDESYHNFYANVNLLLDFDYD